MILKSYWPIALLNCLKKIAEKIIANWLTYWVQKFDLLNKNQIDGRKNQSIVDIIMNLIHDIQHAFHKNHGLIVVLLNIKRAFDHVSKTQLLNMIKQLKLLHQLIQWIKLFMKNRKINLFFDDNKNDFFDIESKIFQKSSILLILYFIYVRNIHLQIYMQIIKFWNFIDDIIVYLNNKLIKSYCQNLKRIIHSIFDWQKSNMIKFDNLKSELIHFKNSRNLSIDIMKLSNETTLQS